MSALRWIPLVLFGVTAASAQDTSPAPAPRGAAGVRLKSTFVTDPPLVDGDGNDPAWRSRKTLTVHAKAVLPEEPGTTDLTVASVYTRTHVYVLASWPDTTHDMTHKTWVWDAAKKSYAVGDDREDLVALAFEHTGVFTADMASAIEATWDVWQWKAARTGQAGYAMDKTHRFSTTKPEGKAKPIAQRGGAGRVYVARPEDAGTSPQRSQPAPQQYRGDRVPQYLPGQPSGSAADVRARGKWKAGRWTVEFSRKLDTGHADDTPFDTSRSYKLGVAAFDRSEHAHHRVSGLLELVFVPKPTGDPDLDGSRCSTDEPREKRGGKISWRQDVLAAMRDAKRLQRPILIYFTADW